MSNNINSGYGQMLMTQIAAAVGPVFGKILFVIPAGDTANKDRITETFGTDLDGKVRVFATVAAAYDAATTNADDVIVLGTNSTHALTEQLTISKNRVHFIGDTSGRLYGQRARISYADGIATALPFAVKNIGVGNTFTGIKFLNNNTDTSVVGTVGEGGEYAVYRNCEFYNATTLDSDTVAELVLGGDSAQFYDCTFGSLADAVSGDKVRPAVLVDGSVVTGGAGTSRDILFKGCRFWKKAGGTATAMIKVASDDDLERLMEINDCQFVANMLGATPAVAIALGASLTKSQILLTGDTSGSDLTKLATGTGVVSCLNLKVATGTIGVQAS
jgi:hypothetical protein